MARIRWTSELKATTRRGALEGGGPALAGFYQAPDQFPGVCGLV